MPNNIQVGFCTEFIRYSTFKDLLSIAVINKTILNILINYLKDVCQLLVYTHIRIE